MIRNPFFLKNIIGIRPRTIIHIGAHHAQDHENYLSAKIKLVIWAEADGDSAKLIQQKCPNDIVVEKLFSDKPKETINFYELYSKQESSLIAPKDRSKIKNTIQKITTTIDDEFYTMNLCEPIMLVIDTQSSELKILAGGIKTLKKIKFVITEINFESDYEISPSEIEISDFLSELGFRKSLFRPSHDGKYKDQLFVKSNIYEIKWYLLADTMISVFLQIIHYLRKGHRPSSIYNCIYCK